MLREAMKKRAVLLDRDGTLIVDKVYLNDPDQIEYLPYAFEALRRLRDAGFAFAVATNQSGIPRGLVDPRNLQEIHRRIRNAFAEQGVDFLGFYYAPYMTNSGHYMRKPNPGMLLMAARDHNLDLTQSWMVGDKMIDVEAGHRAQCKSLLLGHSDTPENSKYKPPEAHAENLLEASEMILSHN